MSVVVEKIGEPGRILVTKGATEEIVKCCSTILKDGQKLPLDAEAEKNIMQKGKTEFYRGVETEVNVLPKVQVEIVVAKVPVGQVIDTVKDVLYTGHIGDGKIFVYNVENVIKVRTGEEGYDALQDGEVD